MLRNTDQCDNYFKINVLHIHFVKKILKKISLSANQAGILVQHFLGPLEMYQWPINQRGLFKSWKCIPPSGLCRRRAPCNVCSSSCRSNSPRGVPPSSGNPLRPEGLKYNMLRPLVSLRLPLVSPRKGGWHGSGISPSLLRWLLSASSRGRSWGWRVQIWHDTQLSEAIAHKHSKEPRAKSVNPPKDGKSWAFSGRGHHTASTTTTSNHSTRSHNTFTLTLDTAKSAKTIEIVF